MSSSSSKYYNRFFATDFLWAASFLICLHGLIIYTTKLRLTGTTIKYNWGYLTFAILAYLTDVIENTIYLGVEFTYPIAHLLPCLIQIKKVLYGLVIIFTIIKVTKRYEVS